MLHYKIVNSDSEFVEFQENNWDLKIISVTPITVNMGAIEGIEDDKKTGMCTSNIGAFIVFKEEINEN